MNDRVTHAMEAGGLLLPEGPVALFGAPADCDLPVEASRLAVIQRDAPAFTAWKARDVSVRTAPEGRFAASIVTLPRARDRAEARIAEACAVTDGLVVLDGAKTDGIESIAKALRARVEIKGMVSKAHGKCLWFDATEALRDWARPAMAPNPEGDMVAPGVFSADGADPASRALAAALPASLKGVVADLGAGWGWLSREILSRDTVAGLHLVEADLAALDCARANVTDRRAHFHWADATVWTAPERIDAVVMNPPFHVGRKGDPKLGQAFIAAAARMLAPSGQLWLVANRHLPYEATLNAAFREVEEAAGDTRFKILRAARPARPRR